MARLCPQCGGTFPDSQAFCTADGAALGQPVQQPAAQPLALQATTAQGGPATARSPMLPGPATEPSSYGIPQLAELARGSVVGEYVVDEQIGEGGMGVIYAARHPIIGKRVAIKVLNPDMAANASIVQRFIQEARAVNQIGHRNIVDIFSFGRLPDGRHYFVMEYLDGQPLSRRLHDPITWQEALDIWLQLASAIEAAHGQGIVHRDLKPDNIFIVPGADGPFVKVLDFGIAKLLGAESVQKTGTGVPMGTPLYMSPEQTRGENVDHRTDLYAVGCILYETIVGQPPFNGNTYFEVMSKQLSEPPPPFSPEHQVNPALEALVFGLLAKEPGARPQSMAVTRKELVRLRELAIQHNQPLFVGATGAAGGPGPSQLITPKVPPQEPTAPWQPAADNAFTVPEPRDTVERDAVATLQANARRRPTMVAPLLGAAALAMVAGAGYVVVRKTPAPQPVPAVVAPPPAPKQGKIKIIATESGVSLMLDGKQVAEGGPVIEAPAAPGHHDIKVVRPGFLPYSNQIVVAAGETSEQVVKLERVPATPVTPPPRPAVAHSRRPSKPATPATHPTTSVPHDRDTTFDPFKQ